MKKTTKILSIILALIMCLGVLPLSASAATISKIEITGITWPNTFEEANWDWTIPSNAGYGKWADKNGNTFFWVETSTKPTTIDEVNAGTYIYKSNGSYTFKPDKYYSIVARVTANSGNTFPTSVLATINGYNVNVKRIDSTHCFVWYTGMKSASLVNSVSITGVTAPVTGAKAKWNCSLPIDLGKTDRKNNIGYSYWVETDEKPKSYDEVRYSHHYYEDGEALTFKPGKYYTFVAEADANSVYYVFSDSATAKINGKTANCRKDEFYGEVRHFELVVWYTFDKTKSSFEKLEIVSPPTNTNLRYRSGDSLDGLKVNAKYSNGTTKDVTDLVDVYDFSSRNKPGTYTATVQLEGETATFKYTVSYAWWQWIIYYCLLGFIWY